MKYMISLGILAMGAIAGAQSFSSFHPITALNGVDISQNISNPLEYTVSMDSNVANDYLTVGGVNYQISNIFGFYGINSNGFDYATGSDQNSWSFVFPGNGTVAGWSGNPAHSAITPGNSLTFDYSSLSPSDPQLGLHVSFASDTPPNWGGGNTFYVTVPQAVPAPSSIAFLGLGALAFVFTRRKL